MSPTPMEAQPADQCHPQAAGQRHRAPGLRTAARSEAERWGWAGATEQLQGYYRQVLQKELSSVA